MARNTILSTVRIVVIHIQNVQNVVSANSALIGIGTEYKLHLGGAVARYRFGIVRVFAYRMLHELRSTLLMTTIILSALVSTGTDPSG